MPEIPEKWITTKKLRHRIEEAVYAILQEPDMVESGIDYLQLTAAMTQATANFAAKGCIEKIRDGKAMSGFEFSVPV